MRINVFARFFTILLLAVGCMGCSRSDRPKLAKVTGKVTYEGKPIADGDIVFHPENGRSAGGLVADGEIVDVATFEANDGVPVGRLKVTVSGYEGPKGDMNNPPRVITPLKYTSVKTTDLTADIESGENTVTFDLKN